MRLSSLATFSIAASILLAAGFPELTQARETVNLFLVPHCTAEKESDCPAFQVGEKNIFQTHGLKNGDILDIDVVLTAPSPSDIWMVRSWLKYDPEVLEARDIQPLSTIIKTLPGEKAIDKKEGIIKIGGDAEGKLTTNSVRIARITFRVLSAKETTISFYDFRDDGKGKTAVLSSQKTDVRDTGRGLKPPPCFDRILGCGITVSLLVSEPSGLIVQSESSPGAATVTASTLPHEAAEEDYLTEDDTMDVSTQEPGPDNTQQLFTELKVQNIASTSRDASIYVSWSALKNTELTGYNVYYGTVSGKYLQRRTVGKSDLSASIRELEQGTHYFLAVRGTNEKNEETAFSDEVEVVVGTENPRARHVTFIERENPITSRNGSNVTGSTGPSDVLSLVFIAAMIGVSLAWRRQMITSPSTKAI